MKRLQEDMVKETGHVAKLEADKQHLIDKLRNTKRQLDSVQTDFKNLKKHLKEQKQDL